MKVRKRNSLEGPMPDLRKVGAIVICLQQKRESAKADSLFVAFLY
jgi:hypothetical protein